MTQDEQPSPVQLEEACPCDEVLAAFMEGKLPDRVRNTVLEHLDSCDRCFDAISLVMEIEVTETANSWGMAKVIKGRFRHWPTMVTLAGATAAALFILILNPDLLRNHNKAIQQVDQLAKAAFLDWAAEGRSPWNFRWPFNVSGPEFQDSYKPTRGWRSPTPENPSAMAAIEACNVALAQDPENPKILSYLVPLHIQAGHFALASKFAEEWVLLEKSPSAMNYLYLAKFLFEESEDSPWLTAMGELYQKDPNNLEVVFNYGRMLSQVRDHDERMRSVWEHYLTLDHDSPYAQEARTILNQVDE